MLSVSEEFGNYESAGIAERSVHDEASRCLQPGLGFVGNSLAPIQHKKTPAETSRRFNEGWLTGIEPATSGTTNQPRPIERPCCIAVRYGFEQKNN
jgi:hypothetical protein